MPRAKKSADFSKAAAGRTPFPKLSQPAMRALAGAGYGYLEQLADVSEDGLLELHGFGPNALEKLRDALRERGLSFATPRK